MLWGRHVDLIVRSLRQDSSVRYMTRQRMFANPGRENIVMETQDNRSREEARHDWESLRAQNIQGESKKTTYVSGLPVGWAGLFKEKIPRMAPYLVRIATKALEDMPNPKLDIIPYGSCDAQVRLASVYSEMDTVAFETNVSAPPHQALYGPCSGVLLRSGNESVEYMPLARPIFLDARIEATMLVTYV